MNCINCGSRLSDMDREYCPHCGHNIRLQRKVEYLSGYYYNQGLEKASIRDLSGAISCLKQSLSYNKSNIQARNLLGLVYFETGEVVAALSEWVISKNLQPRNNLAEEYINKLQSNSNKLEAINETIKKYNHSLILCRQGHEDMAAIQLRKILAQNSKLIKGYHLLALILMKNQEWNKARRILRKAARIDKTNTTTLRFLKEVDEQTGVPTRLELKNMRLFGSTGEKAPQAETAEDLAFPAAPYKERSRVSLFFMFALGLVSGAAAIWLLAVPAIRQEIYRQANEQIVKYSESLASQGVELAKAQGQALESGNTVEETAKQIQEEQRRSSSYDNLISAYVSMVSGDNDTAAANIQKVYVSTLSETAKNLYLTVCAQTGVTGQEDDGSGQEAIDAENSGENYDNYNYASVDESYYDSYYDESYYDESYYDSYYDDSYYDESYY